MRLRVQSGTEGWRARVSASWFRASASSLCLPGLVAVSLVMIPMAAEAQETVVDPPSQDVPAGDSIWISQRHNAGGAFLRSVLIPGWGQAKVGAPNRGAFYFAVESVSLWMIMKTSKTLGSAEDIAALRRADAEARVIASGVTEALKIEGLVDEDEAVLNADELVGIRSQQKEDWLAVGLFVLFLGGADAFVAAHLADFPEPLETVIRPLPDMGVELAFSLPFNPFRPASK